MSDHAPAAGEHQPEPTAAGPAAASPSTVGARRAGPEAILALQRTHGNAAVQRMLIDSDLAGARGRGSAGGPLLLRAPPSAPAAAPAPAPAAPAGAPPGPAAPGPAAPGQAPAAPDPLGQVIKAPPAQGQSVVHVPSQVLLSESREHVRFQLESYFAHKGVDLLEHFNEADDQFKLGFTGTGFDTKEPAPDSPDEAYRKRVVAIVRDELSTLRMQCSVFQTYFQFRANSTLNTMLDTSKEQVEKDKKRYGGKEEGWVFKDYSLNTKSDDTASLADYAKKLNVKYQAYHEVAKSIGEAPRAELPAGGAPTGDAEAAYKKRQEAIDAAHARLEPLEVEYQSLRNDAEGKHPILASYGLDLQGGNTARTLEALASDTGESRAALVVKEISDKLENIETVRKKSADDPARVWKLDRVVGPTKNLPDVQTRFPFSVGMRNAIVDDKVLSVQLDEEFKSMAIGVVTIALAVIAAIPTGGGSLAVAAGATATAAGTVVDLGLLAQAVGEYQFESAASGSNYDKAKAITADEPSLFGLAFQILASSIGASAAVSEVRAAIKEIAALQQEALGLKAATMQAQAELANKLKPQYEQALNNLESAGERASPGAGKKLKQEVVDNPDPGRVRRTAQEPDGPATAKRPGAPIPNALMDGPGGQPMTQADAFSQYHQQIEANPDREYAVLRKGESKQYCVVIGEEKSVHIPNALPEDWTFVTHYHPNFEWLDGRMKRIVESNFVARIPSPEDVLGTATRSRGKSAIMERVDWRDPSRNTNTVYRTTYGYTPLAEDATKGKYWVQYPNEMGGMSPKLEFNSLAEYETWFKGLQPAGPPTVRTPPPVHVP